MVMLLTSEPFKRGSVEPIFPQYIRLEVFKMGLDDHKLVPLSDEEKKLLQEVNPIKINPFLEWLPNLLEHVKIQTGPSGELCDENSAQNRTPFDIYASPYQHSSISAYHLISASPTPSSSKISFTVTLVPGFSYLQKRILSMKVADCRLQAADCSCGIFTQNRS